jgi:hypothetical protein
VSLQTRLQQIVFYNVILSFFFVRRGSPMSQKEAAGADIVMLLRNGGLGTAHLKTASRAVRLPPTTPKKIAMARIAVHFHLLYLRLFCFYQHILY